LSPHSEFQGTIEWLEELYHRPVQPAREVGLARAAFLLERLRNPHRSFRSVHVTGSCGKGSPTTMIGAVLQASGARTGYLRTPHLIQYTERIAIDDEEI